MGRDRDSFLLTLGIVSAAIIMLATISGCASTDPRIITKIETRTVEVPPSLLRCLPEPEARAAWKSQRDVAMYMLKLAEAGEDCRLKLDAVRRLVDAQKSSE